MRGVLYEWFCIVFKTTYHTLILILLLIIALFYLREIINKKKRVDISIRATFNHFNASS